MTSKTFKVEYLQEKFLISAISLDTLKEKVGLKCNPHFLIFLHSPLFKLIIPSQSLLQVVLRNMLTPKYSRPTITT